MFSSRPNYLKLRTNLRLCVNRLKLLEKKKAELALKARKEIADYIRNNKEDRARIRVEHIIREDYLVEAMEIIEMYCDLLLARFGLIERMVELDPGIEEAIATIIWVAPRLSSDVAELKEVSHQFMMKYGKEYAESCRKNDLNNVNEKVIHKLNLTAPPKILVENYMLEIAKSYKVPFEPDPLVILGSPPELSNLIDLDGNSSTTSTTTIVPTTTVASTTTNHDSTTINPQATNYSKENEAFGAGDWLAGNNNNKQPFNYPPPNPGPQPNNNNAFVPFQYPPPPSVGGPPAYFSGNFMGGAGANPNLYSPDPPGPGMNNNLPLYTPTPPFDPTVDAPPQIPSVPPNFRHTMSKQITWDDDVMLPNVPDLDTFGGHGPTNGPPTTSNPGNLNMCNQPPPNNNNTTTATTNFDDLILPDVPTLPDVPSDKSVGATSNKLDDVDFDDLARRFEELKKRK